MKNTIKSRRSSRMKIHMKSKVNLHSPENHQEIKDHGTPNMIQSFLVIPVAHVNEFGNFKESTYTSKK
jgi:hypothetical protein